jgi:hypothetical protein
VVFKQEVNIPMVLATGLVSVVLLGVLILGTQAWFESEEDAENAAKSLNATKTDVQVLREKQTDSLNQLAWTDSNKTAAVIPISRAMDIMVETNGNLPTTQPSGISPAGTGR